MTEHSQPWYILGAGAIGSLWAALAQRANGAPVMLLRDEQRLADYQSREGLIVEWAAGAEVLPVAAETATSSRAPIHQLLICTKAQDTLGALSACAPRLTKDCTVVLLQNGMGVAEQIQQHYPQLRLLQATTTEGVFRPADFHIVHAGRGETRLGMIPGISTGDEDHAREIACRLSFPPIEVNYDADMQSVLWRKLAINCAINPLTVIYRCRNGELLDNPAALQQMHAIVDEVLAVARQVGVKMDDELHQQVMAVAKATALNRSSMLQDIEAGRCTEIEHISGYLWRKAEEVGEKTPHSHALYTAICERHPSAQELT